jgi:serine/threonine-protein kinase
MVTAAITDVWCSSADSPPERDAVHLRPGSLLAGKYLLLRVLGRGGMGVVWLARNTATGAEVVVKTLLPQRASKEALARFRREVRATAHLTHRGIVRVFDLLDLDAEQGFVLMVMERLEGHTLARELQDGCRLGVDQTLDIVLPILSALAHAHREGIVHRDVKRENIFIAVDPDGQQMPKLFDFGISQVQRACEGITLDGEVVGTPFYMSPEQAGGRAVDAPSDVFSVGVLLYEMLSGRHPFLAGERGPDQIHAVLMATHNSAPAPHDDLPPALWRVIERALQKRSEDRYASAADLAAALCDAVPGRVSSIRPIPTAPALSERSPRRTAPTVSGAWAGSRRAVVGLAWGAALVLVGATLSSRGWRDDEAAMAHGIPSAAAAQKTDALPTAEASIVSAAPPGLAALATPRPPHRSSGRRVQVLRDPGF